MTGLSEHDVFIFVAGSGIIIFTARLPGDWVNPSLRER